MLSTAKTRIPWWAWLVSAWSVLVAAAFLGTLVLVLAVTVIETALIVSVILTAPTENPGLARDTVFAAVMIVCNGVVDTRLQSFTFPCRDLGNCQGWACS
jgi:Ca2+/H+ antiporter